MEYKVREVRKQYEDAEQAALFSWARCVPEIRDHVFAIPNGGFRNPREAKRLKAQGVMPGVYDTFLSVARGGHHGLYLEMKKQRQHFRSKLEAEKAVSEAQMEFGKNQTKQGYLCLVCYGWEEAQAEIKKYMKGVDYESNV